MNDKGRIIVNLFSLNQTDQHHASFCFLINKAREGGLEPKWTLNETFSKISLYRMTFKYDP